MEKKGRKSLRMENWRERRCEFVRVCGPMSRRTLCEVISDQGENRKQRHEEKLSEEEGRKNGPAEKYGFTLAGNGCELV